MRCPVRWSPRARSRDRPQSTACLSRSFRRACTATRLDITRSTARSHRGVLPPDPGPDEDHRRTLLRRSCRSREKENGRETASARRVYGPRMRTLVALTVAALAPAGLAAAAPKTPVVKAAHLFDGKSDTVVSPGVVVVQDGKIVAAGTKVQEPAVAEVVDLGNATLIPGLIDAHTHMSFESSSDWKKDELDRFKKPIPQVAIEA